MATYAELLSASTNDTLRNKVRVAIYIAAEAIRTEVDTTANHVNRAKWAKAAFQSADAWVDRILWAVLAQNASATLAAITGASDATVQAAVGNAVNIFADGT